MKKDNRNMIFAVIGIIALWYLSKKAKKTTVPGSNSGSSVPGSVNLSSAANELSTTETKGINFVPDTTTFADDYKLDQLKCK